MAEPSLLDALDVKRGDCIALVGAGGKTTCMERLVREAAARGWSAVMATTTRIWPPQGVERVLCPDGKVPFTFPAGAVTALGRCIGSEGKLHGLDPEHIDALSRGADADLVVYEADGAAGRPLKIHARHEPVVASLSTHVVIVAGVDAVGKPAAGDTIHRIERYTEVTGDPVGSRIGERQVAQVILAAAQSALGGARIAVVLNKVDGSLAEAAALRIAKILSSARPDVHVVLTVRGRPVLAAAGMLERGSV